MQIFFSTCFLPVVGLGPCSPWRYETHPLADGGEKECAKCASVRFGMPSLIFSPLQAQVCKCAKVCAKCALFGLHYYADFVRIIKSVQSVRTLAHSFLRFFNSIPLEKVFIKKRYYYMSARWLFCPCSDALSPSHCTPAHVLTFPRGGEGGVDDWALLSTLGASRREQM